MYRKLDARRITETARQLGVHIAERFPGSGLSRVGDELCRVAHESERRAERLRRPNWLMRSSVAAAIVILLAVAASAMRSIRVPGGTVTLGDFLQCVEAAVNDVVFLGVAVAFLATLESRFKRRIALDGLNELRSIAHIIDMHQLTKDPEHAIERRGAMPAAGNARMMKRADLTRYLDYCSELLAITSKLAALHIQSFSDSVVLDSVNGIQALTVGLSGKIWQKIMILDLIAGPPGAPARIDPTK
jgi:hypothetical protein